MSSEKDRPPRSPAVKRLQSVLEKAPSPENLPGFTGTGPNIKTGPSVGYGQGECVDNIITFVTFFSGYGSVEHILNSGQLPEPR